MQMQACDKSIYNAKMWFKFMQHGVKATQYVVEASWSFDVLQILQISSHRQLPH